MFFVDYTMYLYKIWVQNEWKNIWIYHSWMRKILEQERVGKFISKSIISYPIFLFFSSLFRSYKRVYLYTLVFLDANLSISRKNSQILLLHRIFDSIQLYNGPPPMSSPKKLIRSGNIQMQQTITFLHSTSRIYF